MFFKDLPENVKTNFWNYSLMIIEIDPKAERDDIINMFRRLNLTDYNLNDAEKRNSLSGEFAALAREISDMDFWENNHLFRLSDIKRMKDVEFCGTIILLCRQGIIDQTDQKALNQAYEDLQGGYNEAEKDREIVESAITTIAEFFISDTVKSFLKRKAQLYTLFSVVFYMLRENVKLSDEAKNHLQTFVNLYSVFSNDLDLDGTLDDNEKTVFDWLKKYKLASSEGLNKHTNRMIRFNVLKDFLFGMSAEHEAAQETLLQKMQANPNSNIEDEPDED